MIVKLTPTYKFVCDRCGKEVLSDDDGFLRVERFLVKFHAQTSAVRYHITHESQREVCKDCHKDFIDLAENFFDESNKQEANHETRNRSNFPED